MIQVLVLHMVLSLLSPHAEGSTQTNSSSCPVHINGCSIPCDFPFIYKTKFTSACNKHDLCYSCGQKCDWTRDSCDKAFHKDMDKACQNSSKTKRFFSKIYNWIKNLVVTVIDKVKRYTAAADIYYNSVYHFGHAHFEKVSPARCSLPCANKLGDPSIVLGVYDYGESF